MFNEEQLNEIHEQHIEQVHENAPDQLQGNLVVQNNQVVVQPLNVEVLAGNQLVDGLLNTGKEVHRYRKSLKGWGSLTDAQEADLTQSRRELDQINQILADGDIQIDEKKREKLVLLKGRYEAHLLINNFRYKGDSDEMTAVKDKMMLLESVLNQKTAVTIPANLVDPDHIDNNQEDIKNRINVYSTIVTAYQKAIDACKNYTDNRDSNRGKGLERRNLVAAAMQRMIGELDDLVLGMQLMRRGKITTATDPKDLVAQAALYRKSGQEIPAEWTQKVKANQFRNFSPDKYLSKSPGFDEYKRMGKESESIFRYIESDAKISDIFVPDKNGRLSKEGMKLKEDFLQLYRDLRAFPKNKYYSKTFIIGKKSFTVFQSENNDLVIHDGSIVRKVNSSAQLLADDIALRFAADEKLFGKETTRELSAWMKDEDLDMKDMQTMVRIDSQCKEIISTRLKMRKSDLANISVSKIREIAIGLVDEKITEDQAKKMYNDVEDRVLEKQRVADLNTQNAKIQFSASMIVNFDNKVKEEEKKKEEAIKRIDDKVDKRITAPARNSELRELRRSLDKLKKDKEDYLRLLNEKPEDDKEKEKHDKLLASIKKRYGSQVFNVEGVVSNDSNDIVKAPDFEKFSIVSRIDELTKKAEKEIQKIDASQKKTQEYRELKKDIENERTMLNQQKRKSQKAALADLDYEVKEAKATLDAKKNEIAEKMGAEIDDLESEILALKLSHQNVKGETEKAREDEHKEIRFQTKKKEELLEKKLDELEAFMDIEKVSDSKFDKYEDKRAALSEAKLKKEKAAPQKAEPKKEQAAPQKVEVKKNPEIIELEKKYSELLKKYNEAKGIEDDLGIEDIEKNIKEKQKELDETIEELRPTFYTEEEAERINQINREADEKIKDFNNYKTQYEQLYKKLGGDQKVEEIKTDIETMKLSEKDRLTDQLVNDELTRQKIKLYEKDKDKYDKMIKFEEEKKEEDLEAIELEDEKNALSWSEDEQEFLDLLADLIYNKDTWKMDDKKDDPSFLFADSIAMHLELILKILAEPSILDGFFEKLPLDLMGTEEERTNKMYDELLPEHEKEPDYKDKLKAGFLDVINKYVSENEKISKKVDEIREIKAEIKKAQKAVSDAEFKVYLFEKEKTGGAKALTKEEEEERKIRSQSFFKSLFMKPADEEAQDKLDDAKQKLWDLEDKLESKISDTSLFMAPFIQANSKLMGSSVNEFNKVLDEYMNDKTLTKGIEECVDQLFDFGSIEKTDTTKIPDPKDKHLTPQQKNDAIKKGNEALLDIIKESMAGNEGQGKFIKNIMKNYVTGVTKLDVRSMMSSAIRNLKPTDPNLDSKLVSDGDRLKTYADFLGGVLKGAGPLMQKMMQGIPDQMVPQAFKKSIKDMKSNLEPIPQEVVKAELASMIARSNGKILGIKVVKSLGAASVGQAFLCEIDHAEGRDSVVIKILRPDVRNKMAREKSVMLKSAQEAGEGMYHSYKGMLEVYENEMDLTLEAKNCEKGKIYDLGGGVKSMKMHDIVAPSTNSMVCDMAKGVTLDSMLETMNNEYEAAFGKYIEHDAEGNIVYDGDFPKLNIDSKTPGLIKIKRRFSTQLKRMQDAQKRMIRLAEKWVQEGVFGSGFYHGDLHAGNLVNSNFELTVIDYGNATQLTKDQQAEITRMMVAAAAGDVEGFRNGFKKLLENTSEEDYKKKEPELTAALTEVFRLGDKKSAGQRIAAALMKAQQIGFEIPTSVYNFSQCELRLQNTIDDMNAQIKKYQKALGQIEGFGELESFDVITKLNGISEPQNRTFMISMLVNQSEDSIRETIREKDTIKQSSIDTALYGSFYNLDLEYSKQDKVKLLFDKIARSRDTVAETMEYNFGAAMLYIVSAEDQQKIKAEMDKVLAVIKPAPQDAPAGQKYAEPDEAKRNQVMNDSAKVISDLMVKYNYKPQLAEYREKLAQGVDPDSEEMKKLEDDIYKKLKVLLDNQARNIGDIVTNENKRELASAKSDYIEAVKEAEEDGDQDAKTSAKAEYDDRVVTLEAQKNAILEMCTIDNMVGKLKTGLASTDPATVSMAEKEISEYFRDKENKGDELKKLYEDFRKAQSEGVPGANELLEKFLNKFVFVAGMKRLYNSKFGDNVVLQYDKGEPEDFLDVMGTVVNNNWMTALGRLGTKVSKYRRALAD